MEQIKEKTLTERISELEKKVNAEEEINEDKKRKNKQALLFSIVLAICVGFLAFYFSKIILIGIGSGILVGVLSFAVIKKIKENNEFKLPRSAKLSNSQRKMGYIVVCYITNNKNIYFEKCLLREGVIIGKSKIPHVVDVGDIFLYKNKIPMIIQPEWAKTPLNAEEHFIKTMQTKNGTRGWQWLMNYILKTQIQEKKPIKKRAIILLIIALIVGIYFAFQQGVFK